MSEGSTKALRGAAPVAAPYVSRSEAAAVLRAGASLVAERLAAVFGTLSKAVYDELAGRWDFGTPTQAVRRLINDQLLELRGGFVDRLKARQEEIVEAGLQPQDYGSSLVLEEDLSLTESTVTTTTTAAYRAGGRLRGKLDDQVRPIQAVVRYLLGRATLPVHADPFAPDVATYALVSAAEALDLPAEAWDTLLAAYEPGLAEALSAALADLNAYFLERGLDARVIRRDLAARAAAQRAAASEVAAAAEAAPTPDGTNAAAAVGAFGGAARFDAPKADPTLVLGSLLARLQANARDLPLPPMPRNTPPQARLLEAVSALQGQGLQRLREAPDAGPAWPPAAEWREQLVGASARTVEKLTIELVGLMFEHVLEDRQVPAEIKALLSRLQFPILKAALLDADFFAANNHPARRLIDRIAATSLGWEPTGEYNQRYRAEVERIVMEVLARFDKSTALFDKLADEFERFIAELWLPHQDDPVGRAQQVLEGAERRAALVAGIGAQVARMFDKVELEPYLRTFLTGPWVQALAAAEMVAQEYPELPRRLRAAIPDLVWSVQPKAGPDDRRRLTQLIPDLVGALRDGLALIGTPAAEAGTFFRQLMESHTAAVRPVDQATYIKASLVSSVVKSQVEQLPADSRQLPAPPAGSIEVPAAAVLQAAQAEAVELALPPPPPARAALDRVEEARLNAQIAGWARGDWFELVVGAQVERVRLRWVSPLRSLFLFSARHDREPVVFPLQAVKAQVAAGALRPLERAPLTKRAVESMLEEFERAPHKAQDLAARYVPAPE